MAGFDENKNGFLDEDERRRDIKAIVLKVEILKSDGTALANPQRIGITANNHDRTQHFKVVCNPDAEVINISLTVGNDLSLTNRHVSGNTITFDVVGTAKSTIAGGTFIQAVHAASGAKVKAPVSVIVPSAVGTPHPQPSGNVTGVNMVLNAGTSPAVVVPPGFAFLASQYLQWLSIPVIDQFGESAGDLYAGAAITEDGTPINQQLAPAGTYQDPVGLGRGRLVQAIADTYIDQNANGRWDPEEPLINDYNKNGSWDGVDPAIATWKQQALIPLSANKETQKINVEIDGFALNPAIVNRTVTTVPPAKITITWP